MEQSWTTALILNSSQELSMVLKAHGPSDDRHHTTRRTINSSTSDAFNETVSFLQPAADIRDKGKNRFPGQ